MVCIFTFTHYTPRTSKKVVIEKRNLEKKTISMRSFKLPIIDSVIFLADAVFPVSDSQMHKSDGS